MFSFFGGHIWCFGIKKAYSIDQYLLSSYIIRTTIKGLWGRGKTPYHFYPNRQKSMKTHKNKRKRDMSWIRKGAGKNGMLDVNDMKVCLKSYESRLTIISFVFVGSEESEKHKQSSPRSDLAQERSL